MSKRFAPILCAVLLCLAGIFLFRGQGPLAKHYETNMPSLAEYSTLAIEEGDVLTQTFTSQVHGIYGLNLFLVKEEGITGGDLAITVSDAQTKKTVGEDRMPIATIPNADWFFFTLHAPLVPQGSYEISYRVEHVVSEGSEAGTVYLMVLPPAAAESAPSARTAAELFLNGQPQEGAIAQTLQYRYPTRLLTRVLLFLAIAASLALALFSFLRQKTDDSAKDELMENRFLAFLQKHLYLLCVLFALLLSAGIRYFCLDYKSDDYLSYYYVWWEHYRDLGFVDGMGTMPVDYYVPFNLLLAASAALGIVPRYSILIVSSLADYGIGYYAMRLVQLFRGRKEDGASGKDFLPVLTGLVMVFLPPLWLNGAMWKQCDSVYVLFCLMAAYYVLCRKNRTAWICLGIAFTIKLQAVFLLPFFILLYLIRGDLKIRGFLAVPAAYLLAGLPAILCGASPGEIYRTYFAQLSVHPTMAEAFPNIYNLYIDDYRMFGSIAVFFTTGIFVLSAAYFYYRRKRLSQKLWLLIAAWCVWTCPMFLPNMRERYDLMAVVFLSAIAVGIEHKLLPLAIFLTISSTICHVRYLQWMNGVVNFRLLAVFYAVAYFSFTLYLVWKIEKTAPPALPDPPAATAPDAGR